MWAVIVDSPLKYPHNDDRSIECPGQPRQPGQCPDPDDPRRSPAEHRLLPQAEDAGNAQPAVRPDQRAFGYILTKVDFQSFPRYDYVSRTSLGEMTGEILIEKSLEFVNRSPKPDR